MKINFPPLLRQIRLASLGLVMTLVALPLGVSATDELTFDSPVAAVNALVAAAQNNDTNAIHAIFGPTGRELMSPDVVQATSEYQIGRAHV